MSSITFFHKVFLMLSLALMVKGIAIPDFSKRSNSTSFIKMDLKKVTAKNLNLTHVNSPGSHLSARGADPVTIENVQDEFYYTELSAGSNNQQVGVQLDTGSSDLWFPTPNVYCEIQGLCTELGSFDPSQSSTYQDLGEQFSITYGSGDASGEYGTDDISFAQGSGTLYNQQFGSVTQSASEFGILGIGYTALESTQNTYSNVPALLASQGLISKNAYSLYLNDKDASSGSVIFGGIDNAKYSGDLVQLQSLAYPYLGVPSSGFVTGGGSVNNPSGNLILDSGTTLSAFPGEFLQQLADQLGGTYDSTLFGQNSGGILLDCNASGSFTVQFDGFNLDLDVSDLVLSSEGTCYFGAQEIPDIYLIGDIFLRHLYIVYDLTDNIISLANVKYTSELNIVSI